MKNTFIWMVILFCLAFCGAQAASIFHTVAGCKAAAVGNPGTFILQSEQLYVLAWQYGDKYAFAVFNSAGDPIQDLSMFRNGTVTSYREAAQFANYLLGKGFQSVTPEQLPVSVVEVFSSHTLLALMTMIGKTFPTFMAVPFVTVEPNGWAAEVMVQ